jgi:MFS family permease
MTRFTAYFSQFKGFDRDLKLLLLSSFSTSIVIGLSGIIQPLYLSALGYDSAEVGALLGTSALISVAVLLPAGVVADRYGRKNILILSISAYAVAFGIYAIFTNFQSLFIASTLIGVSWGTYVGPSSAILTDKTNPTERSYVFSLNSFLAAFAIILGSLLAGATDSVGSILHQTSVEAFRTMFWIAVGLTLVALPELLVIHEASFIKRRKGVVAFRSWRLIGLFGAVNGLIGFGAGTLIPLLPLYLRSKFLATDVEIGVLFAVSNAAMGVANLFAPRLSEKIGPVATITFTQAFSMLPLATIPFLTTFSWVAAMYVTRTALMNMSTPILTAYTMSVVSPDERASTSGVITMAWNGAYAVGTMLSGILMRIHLDYPFYGSLLFYTLASISFYLCFKGPRSSHS